jgi:RNA polymerase sigma factor (sigma-70 family)
MNFTLATNEQLWNIMKYDKECPLSLLEGIFREAVNRGMIRQAVIHVIKYKKVTADDRKKLCVSYEDLIQVGYEGALKALRDFEPGRGRFTNLLFCMISQSIGTLFKYQRAKKRQGTEVSYQNMFSDDKVDTYEIYLMDRHTNVEKTVLTKMALEEKMKRLTKVQRDIFDWYFKGYTIREIAKLIDSPRTTVQRRLKEALRKMTGHQINLMELGYERVRKQGA